MSIFDIAKRQKVFFVSILDEGVESTALRLVSRLQESLSTLSKICGLIHTKSRLLSSALFYDLWLEWLGLKHFLT